MLIPSQVQPSHQAATLALALVQADAADRNYTSVTTTPSSEINQCDCV